MVTLKRIRVIFNILTCVLKSIAVTGEAIPFKPIQISLGVNKRFVEAFFSQFLRTGKMIYNTADSILQYKFANLIL